MTGIQEVPVSYQSQMVQTKTVTTTTTTTVNPKFIYFFNFYENKKD